jgi:CheY-like chemotaxis protein
MKMAQKYVLVVEDERPNARLLTLLLQRCGIRAEIAQNGREALTMMGAQRPDLVLLDMIMPIMRGEDVLATMRADSDLRDIPVVTISTLDEYTVDGSCELPHIRKPFDPAEVQRIVCEVLGQPGTNA